MTCPSEPTMELDIRLNEPDVARAAGDRLTGDVRIIVDRDIARASIRAKPTARTQPLKS